MDVNGTEDRIAARIVLVDARERTLLFRGLDPDRPGAGSWWFTPGGGAEPGETIEDAGRRELFEETGVRVDDLGTVVLERYTEFPFAGTVLRQQETYYMVRIDGATVDDAGWTDLERRSVTGYRWWSVDELRTTDQIVYPANMVELLLP